MGETATTDGTSDSSKPSSLPLNPGPCTIRSTRFTRRSQVMKRNAALRDRVAKNETSRVLADTLKAQDKRPGYEQALKEIKMGRKSGHWIWYIWPCLKPLRPGTSRPQYLLPDLEAARVYLKNQTLRQRLCEITIAVSRFQPSTLHPRIHTCTGLLFCFSTTHKLLAGKATEHLRRGADARKLFGGGGDLVKFGETCTFFALAAGMNQDFEALHICCEGLENRSYKGLLNKATMDIIVEKFGHVQFIGLSSTEELRQLFAPAQSATFELNVPLLALMMREVRCKHMLGMCAAVSVMCQEAVRACRTG